MKLGIRFTNPEDYKELSDWWGVWRWGERKPSRDLLDNLRYGIMVTSGETNICAGFIYFTNAKAYGIMEYIVSNPNVKDREIRKKALFLLIESLKSFAKDNGMQVIVSYLVNDNLITKYIESGFIKGDTGATSMICKL